MQLMISLWMCRVGNKDFIHYSRRVLRTQNACRAMFYCHDDKSSTVTISDDASLSLFSLDLK